MSETLERHEFGAEVGRLLDLVVHALYTSARSSSASSSPTPPTPWTAAASRR
jgi:hypothetical protein